jgi:hypothetical protein
MFARVAHPIYWTERERERERESERERRRVRNRERERERCVRKRVRKIEHLFLKGFTGAFSPFSYLVLKY